MMEGDLVGMVGGWGWGWKRFGLGLAEMDWWRFEWRRKKRHGREDSFFLVE